MQGLQNYARSLKKNHYRTVQPLQTYNTSRCQLEFSLFSDYRNTEKFCSKGQNVFKTMKSNLVLFIYKSGLILWMFAHLTMLTFPGTPGEDYCGTNWESLLWKQILGYSILLMTCIQIPDLEKQRKSHAQVSGYIMHSMYICWALFTENMAQK